MTEPKGPGGIKPDADDIQSYQRERRTRMVDRIGDVPDVGGGGGGAGGWLQWLIILLLVGGAYYLYQQLDLTRAQLALDQQRIVSLERQLNVTDESVSESSNQMEKQMQFLDTEIRKLWDNVWKRAKQDLAEHDARITKLDKALESLNGKIAAVEASTAQDRKALAALKVQQQKTQSMAETNWSNIAELKEGGDTASQIAKLEERVKANEEWLESVNVFRKQVNGDLNSLRETVSGFHNGGSGAAGAAE